MHLIFVLLSAVVVNICADNLPLFNNGDEEVDSIIALLLNGDNDGNVDYNENDETIKQQEEEEPKLMDGVWKCGNCTNISESKLLLSETFDLDTNYNENIGIELQIGLSVEKMRCITIETDAIAVRRVSGACAGEEVTLSVLKKSRFEVKVYE